MDLFKNKRNVIIASIVGAVVIIGLIVAIFLVNKKSSSNNQTDQNSNSNNQEQVFTLKPSDIGLSLSAITTGKFAGNGVEMTISKLDEITAIDYELSYTSTGSIPRGAIGHIDVKPTDTTIDQQMAFGTCSDVCHFDTGVSDVKITLKVTKNDGKIYQVEQTYNPPAQ